MTERQIATQICKTIQDTGHQAVFAGGCVRDMLLNKESHDTDIATSLKPTRKSTKTFTRECETFKHYVSILVGTTTTTTTSWYNFVLTKEASPR